MFAIIEDPRSSRMEKILASQIVAACAGVLVPGIDGGLLSTREAVQLELARKTIADRMQRRRERKRLENRLGYLKRKRRQQDDQQQEQETEEKNDK